MFVGIFILQKCIFGQHLENLISRNTVRERSGVPRKLESGEWNRRSVRWRPLLFVTGSRSGWTTMGRFAKCGTTGLRLWPTRSSIGRRTSRLLSSFTTWVSNSPWNVKICVTIDLSLENYHIYHNQYDYRSYPIMNIYQYRYR